MPERRLAKVTSCRHPERVAAVPVRKAPATRAVANDPKFTGTAASTPGRGSAAPAEPPTAGAIVDSNASAHRPRVRDMSETGAKIFQLDLEGWHRSMHTTACDRIHCDSLPGHKRHVHPPADSVWRLRANSSSRRDRAPGFHDTRFPGLRAGETPDLVSRTIFPSSIPANSDTPRQKAECARSVCMSITPSCPCAAVGPIVASFHATCMPTAGIANRQETCLPKVAVSRVTETPKPGESAPATPMTLRRTGAQSLQQRPGLRRVGGIRPRHVAG